ncbi:hypothetical protein JCM14036_21160 [Desulfotomaculum defluvii]
MNSATIWICKALALPTVLMFGMATLFMYLISTVAGTISSLFRLKKEFS